MLYEQCAEEPTATVMQASVAACTLRLCWQLQHMAAVQRCMALTHFENALWLFNDVLLEKRFEFVACKPCIACTCQATGMLQRALLLDSMYWQLQPLVFSALVFSAALEL
jgi:hypothetical protein